MNLFVNQTLEFSTDLFDCVSIKHEAKIIQRNMEVLDYMLTVYPRSENTHNAGFVYGLFEIREIAFSQNQSSIINIANELFSESQLIGGVESYVMNKTYTRLLKATPTLPGRK